MVAHLEKNDMYKFPELVQVRQTSKADFAVSSLAADVGIRLKAGISALEFDTSLK